MNVSRRLLSGLNPLPLLQYAIDHGLTDGQGLVIVKAGQADVVHSDGTITEYKIGDGATAHEHAANIRAVLQQVTTVQDVDRHPLRSGKDQLVRAIALTAARKVGARLDKLSEEETRYTCAECGNEIPPGKAGRKCRKCRAG